MAIFLLFNDYCAFVRRCDGSRRPEARYAFVGAFGSPSAATRYLNSKRAKKEKGLSTRGIWRLMPTSVKTLEELSGGHHCHGEVIAGPYLSEYLSRGKRPDMAYEAVVTTWRDTYFTNTFLLGYR
jgi:hypothetical protein